MAALGANLGLYCISLFCDRLSKQRSRGVSYTRFHGIFDLDRIIDTRSLGPETWSFATWALLVAILSISILVRIPGTRNLVDPRKQDQPARYAEQFLNDAPKGAIVYTTSDQDSFPLWYYHFGLKERQDLRIIVLPLTQFTWYQQTLVHVLHGFELPTGLYTRSIKCRLGK